MNEYKNMLDKISATDDFKKKTEELLIAQTKVHTSADTNAQTEKRTPVFRFVPVLAACLCIVMVLSIIFLPFGGNNNFTITANAESVISDTDFTPISDITASQASFLGLDLSEIAPMLETGEETTDNPKIATKAFFSLNVEGENIESIHFELSDGFFEVSEGITHKLLEPKNEITEQKTGMQDGFKYFETITLDYNNQIQPIGKYFEGDWVAINILRPYDENTHRVLIDNLLNLSAFKPDPQAELESEEYFESTLENFLNEMYKDTKIYVTCTFDNEEQLTKTLELYADCEIIGTKDEYFFTGDSYEIDENTKEEYEIYEIYDYTVELCAKIV